jgi:hypothetical protein
MPGLIRLPPIASDIKAPGVTAAGPLVATTIAIKAAIHDTEIYCTEAEKIKF